VLPKGPHLETERWVKTRKRGGAEQKKIAKHLKSRQSPEQPATVGRGDLSLFSPQGSDIPSGFHRKKEEISQKKGGMK